MRQQDLLLRLAADLEDTKAELRNLRGIVRGLLRALKEDVEPK